MTLQKGASIGRYRVIEPLGAGGMGVIFRAQDTLLGRQVALKALPPGVGADDPEAQILIQEARTASALDHPNICTIFDVQEAPDGAVFIVMPCYEGETLRRKLERGPLSVQEVVALMVQLCDGLGKAHARGVVHRDIKLENLMLTEDGILKILDFGISRLGADPAAGCPGCVLGTPAYMSPEQVKGEAVDHRSDLWSAGVVLYALLTTQFPFQGEDETELLFAIVNQAPRPVTQYRSGLPEGVSEVLSKALAKDPAERYSSADALSSDLKWLTSAAGGPYAHDGAVAPASPVRPSVAVLSFKDLSPAQDQKYLCDGLAEAIISNLGRIRELRVIAPSSTFRFQSSDLGEVARVMGVRNTLEGSIQCSGERLRITVRLVDLVDGGVIWTEQFQEALKDLFEVQDRISGLVADVLATRLGSSPLQKAVSPVTGPSFQAYQHYLQGRFHWNRRNVEGVKQSIQCFTEAIDLSPRFALAFAGLADAYAVLGMYGTYAPSVVMPRAKDSALRALKIDQSLAEAHVSLGCIQAVFDWDWAASEASFRTGIQLNPSYATAHHWLAVNCLVPQGKFEEAVAEMQQAVLLDPVSPAIATSAGLPYYFSGETGQAIECYRKALKLDPDFGPAHFFLGQALASEAKYQEALESFRVSLRLHPDSTNMKSLLGYSAARSGDTRLASEIQQELLQGGRYVSSYDQATLALGLGNQAEAVAFLRKALQEKSYLLVYLRYDPFFEEIRKAGLVADILDSLAG